MRVHHTWQLKLATRPGLSCRQAVPRASSVCWRSHCHLVGWSRCNGPFDGKGQQPRQNCSHHFQHYQLVALCMADPYRPRNCWQGAAVHIFALSTKASYPARCLHSVFVSVIPILELLCSRVLLTLLWHEGSVVTVQLRPCFTLSDSKADADTLRCC